MRDRSSSTIFGGQCRKRLRWCRELRWASIFSVRVAAEAPAATIRANNKKKSYLFELNNRDSILDGDRHSCLSLFIFVHCERRRSRVLPFTRFFSGSSRRPARDPRHKKQRLVPE